MTPLSKDDAPHNSAASTKNTARESSAPDLTRERKPHVTASDEMERVSFEPLESDAKTRWQKTIDSLTGSHADRAIPIHDKFPIEET